MKIKNFNQYNMASQRVFLGGTCNGSQWRERLIPLLQISYFNPVVEEWNEESQQRELEEREACDYCLYVITPKMTGVYSIAEAVDDSNKRPQKTVFAFISDDEDGTILNFNEHQIKSLKSVSRMIISNGGRSFESLSEVANFLNGHE